MRIDDRFVNRRMPEDLRKSFRRWRGIKKQEGEYREEYFEWE